MRAADLSDAWATGPQAIEPLLSEHVVFEWWSGRESPCRGREQVTALLLSHVDPAGRPLTFEDLDDGVVMVHGRAGAFIIHIQGDRVARLVQYDSREHALSTPATEEADGVMSTQHPLARAAVDAIHNGDVDGLRGLLGQHPELATIRLGDRTMTRTLLHVVTDWPGHYPAGAQTVGVLAAAGADINARFTGPHGETPLHWAASSDDVDVLDALLDAGADIEADGAVIAGGTPLADATAFGQWNAARRLIERGARSNLWQAASLGLLDRVQAHLAADNSTPEEITGAFWMACHGSQQATAQLLLNHGADLNWIGYDHLTPLDAAIRSDAIEVVRWLREQGAASATTDSSSE